MYHNSFSPFSTKAVSLSENKPPQLDQVYPINTKIQKNQTISLDQKSIYPSPNSGSSPANTYIYNEEIIKTAKLNFSQLSPLRNQDTNKPNRHFVERLSKSNLMDIQENSNNGTAKQDIKSIFAQKQSYQTPHNPIITMVNPSKSENLAELFTVPLQKNPSLIK